ncbi:MAG: NAD(P)H-dependent oxidoreductase [Campylobacterales bacterium]
MTKDEILSIMQMRHACKLFDEGRLISDEDRATLLEVIRLSPSSFGMEPWRVIVVRSRELKEKLRPLCWNQPQITTCSDLVIFTVDAKILKPGSDYVKRLFARRGFAPEMEAAYLERYANFHQAFAEGYDERRERFQWAARQCYIAAANLMSMAAALGIDSCPIEGFDKGGVEQLLELKSPGREVVLLVALGYRVNPVTPKLRLSLDEIVEIR